MTETIVNHKSQIANRIDFPPWYGEFGWEIMSWAPQLRLQAQGCEKVTVTSFEGMGPLYEDFATEFKSHGQRGRGLDYPKNYRPAGLYHKYGHPEECGVIFDVLFHARGISRKSSINYKRWDEMLALTKKLPATKACIGSKSDIKIGMMPDMRGLGLQQLMNLISRAKLVVGVSSGLMHLAAACGTDLVVWGDRRTYFGETLEKRYKMTWNPFNVKVGWCYDDNFQPEPEQIAEAIKEILS